VDNIVDKLHLTRKKPSNGAGFNKMHVPQAKVFVQLNQRLAFCEDEFTDRVKEIPTRI
jgi:hypothetical protein